MSPAFVNCVPSDPIVPAEKFRLTFTQGTIQNWFFGGTIQSIYQRLSTSAIVYVVSEPPLDSDPVLVVDVRVRNTMSGSQMPGTVTDLVNNLADLTTFDAYDVTRVEQLSTTAPVLEQKSVVRNQALTDAAKSGTAGIVDAVQQTIGSVRSVAVAVTVVAVLLGAWWLYAQAKAARAV